MRDIRFRAWVRRLNRYVDTCFIYNDGSWAYEYEHFTEELGGHIVGCSPCEDDIIEQFTGLYDKNSKPIYEGDIVKIPENWDDYGMSAGEIYQIYFAFGGFRLKPKFLKSSKGFWLEDTKELEIIGNINENQELIKQ